MLEGKLDELFWEEVETSNRENLEILLGKFEEIKGKQIIEFS